MTSAVKPNDNKMHMFERQYLQGAPRRYEYNENFNCPF